MSKILARRGRGSAYRLVLMQVFVAGVVTIIFSGMWGVRFGVSALAGTLIAVLPNFVFATLAFSHSGASSADKVIKSFYLGEAVKMLLTIVLFSLAFLYMDVEFMPLFVTYAIALTVHWAAPLYFKQS
ncbi:MAG: ATP synthase subunit I [Shewanella sp.]|uniref:F0F1 ATP synthase subunit I n=1 Tax=Shewanella sp. SNU WT4 TaxID=2590015 RepID=UPI00112AC2A2|nr:F0F1 ATP synthase subunit I [Shewanella sp. SNU WT4]QDF65475.1 F0F1 ATP synthase subunit I [Shewanella sp. SNU WT4]